MVKKTEDTKKNTNKEKNDMFKVWTDNYTGFLKMWGDSHLKMYRPWIESMGELTDKGARVAQDALPEAYKEFYDEWMKTYQNSFGKFTPLPTPKSNKEILNKLLESAERSNNLYRSMIEELEENSKKTRELLNGEPEPAKYTECYNMWMKSYEKMFEEYLVEPAIEGTREMLGNYPGVPDIYSEAYKQMSKLWKDSYAGHYKPWAESMLKLSEKIEEISRGETGPEAYKEFYGLWMNTYRENFSRLFDGNSMNSSKEMYEQFLHSANIYVNMYKSWIAALEKMSEKSMELSSYTDPAAYREFCDLWIKMYQKAFESFFDDMPLVGPMKETMEPVRIAAKTYSDTLVEMAKMWKNSSFNPAGRN